MQPRQRNTGNRDSWSYLDSGGRTPYHDCSCFHGRSKRKNVGAMIAQTNEQGTSASTQVNAGKRTVQLTLSRTWIALFIAVLVIPWAVMAVLLVEHVKDSSIVRRRDLVGRPELLPGNGGPWGAVAYMPLVMSPPMEYISQLDPQAIGNPWYFAQFDETKLADFFAGVDVAEETRRRILSMAKPVDAPAMGMIVTPDTEIIRGLSPKARGQIY